MGIPREVLFVPSRGVSEQDAGAGQRGDGHCTGCRYHLEDTRKIPAPSPLQNKSQKDQIQGLKVNHHQQHELVHESPDGFSVLQALPASREVLSGLHFLEGMAQAAVMGMSCHVQRVKKYRGTD